MNNIYTTKNMYMMGNLYYNLLRIMNKNVKDPYSQTSDIFPFRSILMVLPRTISVGIPEDINNKVAELMDMFDPDDIEKLITTQTPLELRPCWHNGYFDAYLKSIKAK